MLTVILTGAALIRECEQGTVEHLLVMPIVAPEIMLAKMIVHWLIGSPINGSLLLLSGSSTPMEGVPVWLQYLVQTVSPTPHFVQFAQAVLFRGANIPLVCRPIAAMVAIGIVTNAVAQARFKGVIFGG